MRILTWTILQTLGLIEITAISTVSVSWGKCWWRFPRPACHSCSKEFWDAPRVPCRFTVYMGRGLTRNSRLSLFKVNNFLISSFFSLSLAKRLSFHPKSISFSWDINIYIRKWKKNISKRSEIPSPSICLHRMTTWNSQLAFKFLFDYSGCASVPNSFLSNDDHYVLSKHLGFNHVQTTGIYNFFWTTVSLLYANSKKYDRPIWYFEPDVW